MMAKGGLVPVVLSTLPSVVIFLLSFFFYPPFVYPALLLISLPVFTLYFFRDPERKISHGIVSPADGKVIRVNDEEEKRIDIFMGVDDVHVNRAPIGGEVEEMRRENGGHAPAYSESSENNERLVITLKTDHGSVKITQVVGIFARRIVPYVQEGDTLAKGEKIGMIRFGSRVKLELPSSMEFEVEEEERVRAGETTLGDWHGR